MSTYARGRLEGVALTGALVAVAALVGLPGGAGATGKRLWHERSEAAAPALPAGFQPLPTLAPLVKTLKPAVVSVSTSNLAGRRRAGRPDSEEYFKPFFGDRERDERATPRSQGSGFIIHETGLVLTNNHVIEGADAIDVKLADGREFKADVVGRDPKTDVALVRLRAAANLPTVVLGDSDALEVGDWVIAIGNPFGLAHSVSAGIVSAKERFIGAGPYDDFIQTDAAINPGNSGGPLFNAKGEVIGMNTAIVAHGQGIGFAVPVNLIKALAPQLEQSGRVSRGWLGVAIQEMSPELARSLNLDRVRGALVSEVVSGSPAERAGLRAGDVVLSVEGRGIESYNQLTRAIALFAPGSALKLGYLRDGKEGQLTVTVGERDESGRIAAKVPPGTPGAGPAGPLGLGVGALTPEASRASGVRVGEGVLVQKVEAGSPAAMAGVMPGDVVLEVNRRRVRNATEFAAALGTVRAGDMVLLRVQSGDVARFIAVRAAGR